LGPFVHRQPGYFLCVQEYLALIWLNQSYHHVKGSGFAGAVWAQQPYYFTLGHINGNMVHHGTVPVAFYKVFGMDSDSQLKSICAKIPEKIYNYLCPGRFNYLSFGLA
jgi:hypothetical protein